MPVLRKIIFWVFAAVYLAVCPVLVLYSSGYIYNPVKGDLKHTGLARISTIPAGADIFLGKSRFAAKTPATISELLPGRYHLRLSLKGHKPWTHTLLIEAGKAAVFENIYLLPNAWQSERLSGQAFKSLIPLPGTDFILLAVDSYLGDYYVYDHVKGTISYLALSNSEFFTFPVSDIYTEEASRRFVVYGGSFLDRKYLLVDIRNTGAKIRDIGRLFPGRPQYINWGPEDSEQMVAYYPGRLDLINLKTFTSTSRFLENIRGYGFYDKRLYYIDAGYNIGRVSLADGKRDIISENSFLNENIFKKNGIYQMKFLSEKTTFFLNRRGRLLTNLAPYELEQESVEGILLHKSKEAMAYWTKHKIAVAHFVRADSDEFTFGYGILPFVFHGKGRQIGQCFFAIDPSHIVFRDGEDVFLLEIFPDKQSHVELLFKVKSGSSIFYSDAARSIYYLDPKDGVLRRVKI